MPPVDALLASERKAKPETKGVQMKPERIQFANTTFSVVRVPARARMTIETWEHVQAFSIGPCLQQLAKGLGIQGLLTPVDDNGRLTVSIPVESAEGLSELEKEFFARAKAIGDVITTPFEAS